MTEKIDIKTEKKDRKSEFYSPLPKIMKAMLAISMVLCAVFAAAYGQLGKSWMLACAISFGCCAYHLVIRFLSPVVLFALFRKKYAHDSWWFRQRAWEPRLYELIRVKSWKARVLAYDPSEFSLKIHSADEIVANMCHAEAVHELIIALGFLSLLFALLFGSIAVFLITAVAAGLVDLVPVVLQRYNRPRFLTLIKKKGM